jgi:hypothetical protein
MGVPDSTRSREAQPRVSPHGSNAISDTTGKVPFVFVVLPFEWRWHITFILDIFLVDGRPVATSSPRELGCILQLYRRAWVAQRIWTLT